MAISLLPAAFGGGARAGDDEMLISCGDALIDFVPTTTADGRQALLPMVGGSCLNVAIGFARLGGPAGFVGGISTDMFGQMIAEQATASGVELRFATRNDRQTTLAFARIVSDESYYAFYDSDTAAHHWTYRRGTIPLEAVEAVHVGSTTLVHEKCAHETLALIAVAREFGSHASATISLDPNCRPNLVKDKRAYLARMAEFVASADIIRISAADFTYLYGNVPYQQKADAMLADGASLVIITRGIDGAVAWHQNAGQIEIPASRVKVVDTIGAGDSFQAALLFALREQGRLARKQLASISAGELRRALSFAAYCSGVTCTRPGADPPWGHQIES